MLALTGWCFQDDPSQSHYLDEGSSTNPFLASSQLPSSQSIPLRNYSVNLTRMNFGSPGSSQSKSQTYSQSQSSQGRLSQASQPKKKSRMGFWNVYSVWECIVWDFGITLAGFATLGMKWENLDTGSKLIKEDHLHDVWRSHCKLFGRTEWNLLPQLCMCVSVRVCVHARNWLSSCSCLMNVTFCDKSWGSTCRINWNCRAKMVIINLRSAKSRSLNYARACYNYKV